MGSKQEAVVRSLLDHLAADELDAAVEDYAEGARYNVSAWHDALVGREAIRAEFERQAGLHSSFRYDLLNISSTDTVVFTERLDTITVDGKDVTLHWSSVHEIDPGGKITATRDYYDMQELKTRLA